MRLRSLALIRVLLVIAGVWLASEAIAGQTAKATTTGPAKTWTAPRTPDDQPDLQGVWNFSGITPLERPSALGNKQVFTDEEAAAFERDENRRQNRDLIDSAKGGANYPAGGVVPYNEFWYDRGNKVIGSKRTSLIVDPPNGRLPPLTPEAKKRAERRAEIQRDEQLGLAHADSYEDRPLGERCIVWGNVVPMVPGPYNNNVQLFQTRDSVVILNEMIHEHRIVPLDGRPHGSIRQWLGDSRGHWQDNTLVIDTTNFSNFRGNPTGPSGKVHLVERFTRVDANTLLYEFTVDDPATWTGSWTAAIPMQKTQDLIYEYACHEGNHGIVGVLSGARAQEKATADAAKKGLK